MASTSSARTVESMALEDRLHGSRIKSGMTDQSDKARKFCYELNSYLHPQNKGQQQISSMNLHNHALSRAASP